MMFAIGLDGKLFMLSGNKIVEDIALATQSPTPQWLLEFDLKSRSERYRFSDNVLFNH